jgi:hypothetical protein
MWDFCFIGYFMASSAEKWLHHEEGEVMMSFYILITHTIFSSPGKQSSAMH